MKQSTVHSPSASAKATADKQSTVRSGERRHQSLGFRVRPSNFGDREGVALVITLIMLAIITFMAVTFLVLSNRERSSVSTAMDQKVARNASDGGLARVSAELLTRIMLQTNLQDFDLMVSTNYINYHGLHGGSPGNLSPTNVNYEYMDDGTPVANSQDRNINIASLMFNPRPPVFPVTNSGTGQNEFRYYFDLNRNGRYDKNGKWPVVVNDNTGNPMYLNTNGTFVRMDVPVPNGTVLVTNAFIGDPEWIGVLERPQELHSADNHFIARYAYIVIPAGKTLDVNYIHDRAKRLSPLGEGYFRNQGVGTWEINLAGFLADLNTNAWWNFVGGIPGYTYNQNLGAVSTGTAFTDANDILNYRYGPPGYSSLSPATALLPNAGLLASDGIDEYSDGPLMQGTSTNEGVPVDATGAPWSGSENSNHFFSTQDIFSRMPAGFRTELSNLGTSNDSYNAYTFYRMLAQLGTDSAVETNKLNINFKNTDIHGHIVPGMETNLLAWTPEDFFTNASDRILAQITNSMGVALSSAYIPLYPTNYYTPAVHRALQLAANIFDATTNRAIVAGQTNAFFPSVFRPIFGSANGQLWISGFIEVTNLDPLQFQWLNMKRAAIIPPATKAGINVYGVPWVIGAKQGFPNFNEYAMETATSFSRKLKLFKRAPGATAVTDVKQLFEVGITNSLAIEGWNSYPQAYPRDLRVSASNQILFSLTNQLGVNLVPPGWTSGYFFQSVTNIPGGQWSPFTSQTQPNNSIIVPFQGCDVFFTNSTYIQNPPHFIANDPAAFISEASNAMPELFFTTTNRVQFSIVDLAAQRVVDFVNLEDITTFNISEEARRRTTCNGPSHNNFNSDQSWWCTQVQQGAGSIPGIVLNKGVNFQINVAAGYDQTITKKDWADAGADPNNFSQKDEFRLFISRDPGNTNLDMQSPFNPTSFIYHHTEWQANDPLVHYTIGDLVSPAKSAIDSVQANPPLPNIGRINTRYRPWGGYVQNQDNTTDFNPALKDPGITDSSVWDFPTNRFPNVGWLGRVHRGTPWQTVYMKSPMVALNDWKNWSGNSVVEPNGSQDTPLTLPVNDYGLFDLFTTAINNNAARGQLNVNQTNLAAWSAILSGVNVLTNSLTGVVGPAVIAPAGVYDTNNPTAVARIWAGINAARANNNTNFIVFKNHAFQHAGDVLAAPELTIASPFLNTNNPVPGSKRNSMPGITDEVMERIPQQIMSLLTLNQAPRFVIYSFGQTLHPADHSLVTGGTFNGLCTNYQITAESAVRAVVRVEGTPDPKFVGGKVDSQGRSYPPHLVVEQFNVLGPD